MKQKITTFLWFDNQAETAANFYCSLFPDARILKTVYYTEAGPGPPGSVLTVEFELAGTTFVALNGGPIFKFTEAISLSVDCADQAEIDHYWNALTSDGGEPSQCGWLKDRFGLSWQIVPSAMSKLVSDPKRSSAVVRAMLTMSKLDLATLQAAYDHA